MSAGAFGARRAAWLAGIAGASLAGAALLGVYGDAVFEPPTFEADAWSRSAIGHRAFLDLVRALGHEVIVSRHATADKGGDGAVVALLEPTLEEDEAGPRTAILRDVEEDATRLLVVLPKRTGVPDPVHPRWLAFATLRPVAEAERVLARLGIEGTVVRPDHTVGAWRGDLPVPALDHPQLVRSKRLAPLLEADEGILIGEIAEQGWHVVVVADPDVLATHGLGLGDNAVIALRALERLGAGEVPIVVDETLHGNAQQPSLARELLRFPLVLATLHALLAAGLLAWTALVRFGRPRPPERLLAPGKLFLIENTAELLRHGGHVHEAALAYLRAARDEVLARLRPPPGSAPDAWLARMEAARGRAGALARLEARVRALAGRRRGAEQAALHAALAIHRWREELTDGAAGDPGRHR